MILLLVLIFLGPIVIIVLATWHEHRVLRARAADMQTAATKGAVRSGWADEPENAMYRATSPLRLAALRALVVGGALALPVALLALEGGLARQHVGWVVVSGHAALGVAVAAFIERRTAGRRRPTTGAIQAGLVSLVAVTIGVLQQEAAAATLLDGGPSAGLAVQAQLLDAITREPGEFGLHLALTLLWITLAWALPFTAMTYEQLAPGEAQVHVLVALFTLALGVPAALLFSACFALATWLDRRIGRPPAGTVA